MNGTPYCHVSAQIDQHAHDEGLREIRELQIESLSEEVYDNGKKTLDTSRVHIAPRFHHLQVNDDVLNTLRLLWDDPDLTLNKAIDLIVREKLEPQQ
ncbi:hypothetical protein NX722_28560 [Endozoicomonas gorgoniicola]|uniref:Uncharacterized protein n=1 Tax=Endozoicomonas gorgoniicola TaxID=1234144 RepID=A0ABT3N4H0_9GAMM|nr:hypothetical protein [Endozoicomonas gorgoniicola]MCW7556459.1 hypothetical protein [Endozoicomonas gorgoniicola]MCW7556520.1 hypothetical protein [Endozoicomonas gorgoniicola]